MTHPVPGFPVSTAYGRRGSHWSCNPDASGDGVHTGADIAAPTGTPVVACRPGLLVYVHYGSAFGDRQVAVEAADGSEDFYAHLDTRAGAGQQVDAGQQIGTVGARGNVTGPHLHLERHPTAGFWSCTNHTDPQPSLDWEDPNMPLSQEDLDRVAGVVRDVTLDVVRKEGISGAATGTHGGANPSTPVADTIVGEIRKLATGLYDQLGAAGSRTREQAGQVALLIAVLALVLAAYLIGATT